MDPQLLIPLAASLLGTVIGGGVVLTSQRLQWRQDQHVAHDTDLRQAAEEVIVHAHALDIASHQAISITSGFATLGGTLNRFLRIVTPLDQHALLAPMTQHFEALQRATARLRLTQDQATIGHVNEVMAAAGAVIEAHSALLPAAPIVNLFRRLVGRLARDNAQVVAARSDLAAAVEGLIGATRSRLQLDSVELTSN